MKTPEQKAMEKDCSVALTAGRIACVGDGVLNKVVRIVVETDEENPVTIATITAKDIDVAGGYRVRLKPIEG